MTYDSNDPFAPSKPKTPSVKFTNAGDGVAGTIVEAPSLVQARDINTGELQTWPDGNPKFNVVIRVKNSAGIEQNLWVPKPSNMYAGFEAAISRLGRGPKVGDTIRVEFVGSEPASNPKFTRKVYTVELEGAPF